MSVPAPWFVDRPVSRREAPGFIFVWQFREMKPAGLRPREGSPGPGLAA